MTVKLKAPKGKVRLVGIDLFSHDEYLVGDYLDQKTAFDIADNENSKRDGPMDDVHYVYNDKGERIRGQEQEVSP